MFIEKFSRLPDLKSRLGIGKSTIYALIKEGKFPPPVKLGRRAVGWRESDLVDWMAARNSQAAPGQDRPAKTARSSS